MKVIFLDHDGVICLLDQWGKRFKHKTQFDPFDKKALQVLNKVLESTGAVIVCSSDWRLHAPLEDMQALYQERGIVGELLDYTDIYDMEPNERSLPDKMLLASIRTREITAWVNQFKPEKWVAIDDLPLTVENFVHTPRSTEGIKQTGLIDKVMSFLC